MLHFDVCPSSLHLIPLPSHRESRLERCSSELRPGRRSGPRLLLVGAISPDRPKMACMDFGDVKNCCKDENAKAKPAANDTLHDLDRASPPAQVGLSAFVHYLAILSI